jgi:spore germination protein YaaH
VIQVHEPVAGQQSPKKVYGYVPYWNLYSATPSATLTDVSYFSLTLSGGGEIVEQTEDGPDMGLRRMQSENFTEWLSERATAGQKAHITFTMLSNDDISVFLASAPAQQRAIQNITQVMASYPFSGVNLDVEYSGQATPAQRQAYADFVAQVRKALDTQSPGTELSVAIFGSAASKPLLWDVAALEPSVDSFVMMAYDYHVRSSTVAGPVAPIFGKQSGRWQEDIITNLRDLVKIVPPQKVLLGIPFYGYEWTTTGTQPGSNTFPRSGFTATYDRVSKLLSGDIAAAQLTTRWDEDALSPYLTYSEDGETQLIYYEDARSLSYKLDLVRQVDLGGVAIWAIGYEGTNSELWDVIEAKLGNGASSNGL